MDRERTRPIEPSREHFLKITEEMVAAESQLNLMGVDFVKALRPGYWGERDGLRAEPYPSWVTISVRA